MLRYATSAAFELLLSRVAAGVWGDTKYRQGHWRGIGWVAQPSILRKPPRL